MSIAIAILGLAQELLALGPGFHVLVIDDNSPDGTWKLVADASRAEPRLHLLHRLHDKGRGRAGRDGDIDVSRSTARYSSSRASVVCRSFSSRA